MQLRLVQWFLCCSPVSKWLLYRQRRALCCEMLLRHNWVRLVRRGHISAIQRGILASSDTGLILLEWAYVYLEVNKKKIRRWCFERRKD